MGKDLSLKLESCKRVKVREDRGGEITLLEWSYGEAESGDGKGKIVHRLAGETWGDLEG
jgi:hypothetical protein